MKLSFSTNGWVDYIWKDFLDMSKDFDFQGIEIHNLRKDILSGKGRSFSLQNISETARNIAASNIEIPCIDTTCNISDKSKLDENCKEIEEYIIMAKALKCPNIRLRSYDSYKSDLSDEIVIECIGRTLDMAEKAGVSLLIETVGMYSDTLRLRKLLESFASDNVGALWDFHHPYRNAGESPDTTIQNLGAFIRHVHVKDSDIQSDELAFSLMGEGSLPVSEMINALRSINYEKFI